MTRSEGWDVAVIGGGIVGIATGLELVARGRRVCVVDPGDAKARASFGNAGAINRCSVLTVASPSIWPNLVGYALNRNPAVRIRWSSLGSFTRWLPRFLASSNAAAWRRAGASLGQLTAVAYEHHLALANLADAASLIRRTGYVKLYREASAFAATGLEQEILGAAGVAWVDLDRRQLRDLEPSLRDVFANARLFPESGLVDTPGDLVEALWRAFIGRGGGYLDARVGRIRPQLDGVELDIVGGSLLKADAVVVAGGVASGALLAPLGLRFPLAAERGYHAQMRLADGEALRTPFHDVGGAFTGSPMAGGVRLFSGIELAAPDDPPNPRQLCTAVTRARGMLPLAEEDPSTTWMGSRPSIADGLPVIGPAPGLPRLYLAVGHGHIGFSTGPATGRIIADLICGLDPCIPIAAFGAGRFAA